MNFSYQVIYIKQLHSDIPSHFYTNEALGQHICCQLSKKINTVFTQLQDEDPPFNNGKTKPHLRSK